MGRMEREDVGAVAKDAIRPSLSDEVFRRMLVSISEGQWPEGGKIPSESALCGMYRVSRVSVRSAIGRLQGQGLVTTVRGVGTFVSPHRERDGAEPSDLTSRTFWDFLDFRMAIEHRAIGLFVERAEPEDVRHLGALVEKMYACGENVEAFTGLDYAFHDAILRGARNPFLTKALEPYAGRYFHYLGEILRCADKPLSRISREHEALFKALRDKKPDEARACLVVDLNNYRASHPVEG